MSLIDSVRVLGAMARVTAPSLVELVRGDLQRESIDERTRWFGRRVVELLDIPVLYATLPSPTIRMLGKKELFQIPLWGRGLRAAEFIEVDRSNHVRALASIEYAARLVRDGVSIYLAPEGTRSRDGRIGKLKKGGFHLALDTATPIVPVAIRGTFAFLPRGGKSARTGQPVDVTIGAPIEVAGRELDGLMRDVQDFFVEHVEARTPPK